MGKFANAFASDDEPIAKERKAAKALEGVPQEMTDTAFIKQELRLIVALQQQILAKLGGSITPGFAKKELPTPPIVKVNGGPAKKEPWTEVPGAEAMLEAAKKYLEANGPKKLKALLATFAVTKVSELTDEQSAAFVEAANG
jgi:hypothetical protein